VASTMGTRPRCVIFAKNRRIGPLDPSFRIPYDQSRQPNLAESRSTTTTSAGTTGMIDTQTNSIPTNPIARMAEPAKLGDRERAVRDGGDASSDELGPEGVEDSLHARDRLGNPRAQNSR